MFRSPLEPAALFAAILAVVAAPKGAAQSPLANYTRYGNGCPGGGSTGATGLPEFGRGFAIELAGARPNAPAFVLLGVSNVVHGGMPLPFDLTPLGAPGCTLLTSIEDALQVVTDAQGAARVAFTIPNEPELAGFHLYHQWAVLDSAVNNLGAVFSDAGDAMLGFEPQLALRSFGPTRGGLGQDIEIVANDFGDEPRDQCIRAMDPTTGAAALFMGTEIRDLPNGDQVLRARLVHVQEGFRAGPLHVFRGQSRNAPVGGRRYLTAPGDEWSWDGNTETANAGQVGTFTLGGPAMPGGTIEYRAKWQNDGTTIWVDIPSTDPCPGGGLFWPVGTRITNDTHWNVTCPGRSRRHYDCWLDTVTVARAGASGSLVADEHARQLGEVFDARYGGEVPMTWSALPGPPGFIRIEGRPVAGCTLQANYIVGEILVDCPDRAEALVVEGFPGTGQSLVRVDVDGNATVVTASLPIGLDDVESSADGSRALFTVGGQVFVRTIDGGAQTSFQPFGGGATSVGIRVTPRDHVLVFESVGAGGTSLEVYSLQGVLLGNATVNSFDHLAVSAGGGYALLASTGSTVLSLVRLGVLGTPTVLGTLDTGASSGTQRVEFSPADDLGLTANRDGSVSLVDFVNGYTATAPVTNLVVSVGSVGLGVAIDAEGDDALVLMQTAGVGNWNLFQVPVDVLFSASLGTPTSILTGGPSIFLPVNGDERYLGFLDYTEHLAVRLPGSNTLDIRHWDGNALSAHASYAQSGLSSLLGFARRER